ncbi:MAG: excinuclease ABC subunit UvrB [Mycoplasmoidaceae bacterium]|nr:MAG: excinuclease ABC subunit UvrB [Mycoplasmoidaceae bacterium]
MFKLVSKYKPKADQINAIKELSSGIKNKKHQVLLGATGTGKTFTIANVIEQTQKKTLIMVHNKTLAAQLYGEFKELFPNNNVEYFVSYFDFYQPEAYIPRTDSFIEKTAQSNQEIEMLRLSAINSLASNENTIIVASVAAIYGSSSPEDFNEYRIMLKVKEKFNRKQFLYNLIRLQYKRNDVEFAKGTFRIKGDTIFIVPGYTDQYAIRISTFDDAIEKIDMVDSLNSKVLKSLQLIQIVPANEYIANKDRLDESIKRIRKELDERIKYFKSNNQLLEAQRIEQRTNHDLEMLVELGYTNGIENYSRHLELRESGSTPYTIFDYFKNDDWLLVIDESHMTIPQIRGMYNTDRSRKETLVEYGFRLPSALDNRPLNFEEFQKKIKHAIYVSATPDEWEIKQSNNTVVQQVIRPTGLLDPIIEIKSSANQIEELINKLNSQKKLDERTFITVITIKMAEELSMFLHEKGHKVAYLHNELDTIQRSAILNDLRRGKIDSIVGINLLREGIDAPEVSLVVVFDADKPGLFRSTKSLIQTFGRAARNSNGRVLLFADKITKEMKAAIDETERRRNIQIAYNKKNNITPKTIDKPIFGDLRSEEGAKAIEAMFHKQVNIKNKTKSIAILKKEMKIAADNQEYEKAAYLRDILLELESK